MHFFFNAILRWCPYFWLTFYHLTLSGGAPEGGAVFFIFASWNIYRFRSDPQESESKMQFRIRALKILQIWVDPIFFNSTVFRSFFLIMAFWIRICSGSGQSSQVQAYTLLQVRWPVTVNFEVSYFINGLRLLGHTVIQRGTPTFYFRVGGWYQVLGAALDKVVEHLDKQLI